jgi:hypothetical protein
VKTDDYGLGLTIGFVLGVIAGAGLVLAVIA